MARLSDLEGRLSAWQTAGVIDPATAERIRRWEETASPRGDLRWPVVALLAGGGLMLAAGILLFVAAHWDALSPGGRFGLVLVLVGSFHLAGALASEHTPALSATLHGIGTAALGAGIFLAGQIFNLQEHWPSGILLWALGAWIGWGLRRDWIQLLFASVLTPAWLVGEWVTRFGGLDRAQGSIPTAGLLLLALTYLWAELPGHRSPERRALAVVGAIAVIPLAIMLPLLGSGFGVRIGTEIRSPVGAGLAVVLPLLLGLVLRGVESWPLILAAVWVTVGTLLDKPIGFHLWSAIGAVGLVAGGIRDQSPRRINLGIAGFALAVILFYFSSVMDRLGRSASLVVGGGLFLAGAWGLERLRRRLMAQIPPEITS